METQILENIIQNMKSCTVKTFGPHCDSGIYTPKVHFLNPLGEDLRILRNISFTDASAFERFKVVVKRSYRYTSRWQGKGYRRL